MKKIVLSFIAVLALSFSYAQSVEIGAKLGANLSQAKSTIFNENPDINTSLHGGLFVLAKFSFLGIQPEFILSKQGTGKNSDLQNGLLKTGGIELDLLFLNIPVMAKLYLPLGLNLQVGPQFGIVVDKGDSKIKQAFNSALLDINDKLSNNDFSVAFGAGWDAPFGLKVDARYVLGITDLTAEGAEKTLGELKNNNFQISIGYTLFKLGK